MRRLALLALLLLASPALAQHISPPPANTAGFAVLGANTFTATQTVNPAVNTPAWLTTGYSLTGSNAQSLLDMSGTLNTTGSPDVIALRITDTARGAATTFLNLYGGASGTTSEFAVDRVGSWLVGGVTINQAKVYLSTGDSTNAIAFDLAGSNRVVFSNTTNDGIRAGSGIAIGWSSAATPTAGLMDTFLRRDAALTVAVRNNAATANAFRVYNTWTDASNGEWGEINWITNANVLTIGTKANGTGTTRNLEFEIGGTNQFDFGVTTAAIWTTPASLAAKDLQTKTIYSVAGTPLPTCNGAAEGKRASVSDALTPTFLTNYTGSSTTHASVYCDGTNWKTD